eukprot:CAMPEP_0115131386 /NCGR_PEP_ID=MMETSP0227-20121206/53083_1 /TAXON_ID=89957 /ORGANISM="Polarella glacialis, Strain CCMP 1383" /LENGTH=446 /DNA_ID=CAMNT_0002536891 /DNA_START=93 /DNA_END=1433 /DNA_ORIENTATION=-
MAGISKSPPSPVKQQQKGEVSGAKGPAWKPFPWNWLPNNVAWAWGAAECAFIGPLMVILIGTVVGWMEACKYIWAHPRFSLVRKYLPEAIRSVSRPLGRVMLTDPRNHSYLQWMLLLVFVVPGLFFWAMWRHAHYGFELSTLLIYHVLRLGPRFQVFSHGHTLAHKEGHDHKGIFKKPFRSLNILGEWWCGIFYGIVPNSYSVAHMKIHHRWHNDVDDVHTNLDLDRTNINSFLIYVPRFTLYWTGISAVALFIKRKEWTLVRQQLTGMVAYYGVSALMFYWNPLFCTLYWGFCHIEGCVFLSCISYLWHAFVEESDPGNQYVNSVTILDGHDNVWNEDFHVVHHHSPGTHWTEMPAHFEANKHKYEAVTATIFRDCEQGMLIKWLFENDWDSMAKHFVDLSGKLSHEEIKALIVRRLTYIAGESGRDGKRQLEWGASDTIRNYND